MPVVDVSFDAVADSKLRGCLQNLSTSFALSEEAVGRLRASGAQVLRDSAAFEVRRKPGAAAVIAKTVDVTRTA